MLFENMLIDDVFKEIINYLSLDDLFVLASLSKGMHQLTMRNKHHYMVSEGISFIQLVRAIKAESNNHAFTDNTDAVQEVFSKYLTGFFKNKYKQFNSSGLLTRLLKVRDEILHQQDELIDSARDKSYADAYRLLRAISYKSSIGEKTYSKKKSSLDFMFSMLAAWLMLLAGISLLIAFIFLSDAKEYLSLNGISGLMLLCFSMLACVGGSGLCLTSRDEYKCDLYSNLSIDYLTKEDKAVYQRIEEHYSAQLRNHLVTGAANQKIADIYEFLHGLLDKISNKNSLLFKGQDLLQAVGSVIKELREIEQAIFHSSRARNAKVFLNWKQGICGINSYKEKAASVSTLLERFAIWQTNSKKEYARHNYQTIVQIPDSERLPLLKSR